ncbi:MAG: hypothetical protein HRT54_24220 [Colwellia sp.]|nr:hypothetical protein [Colwellia sp.]
MKQIFIILSILFSSYSNSKEVVIGSDCAYRSDSKVTLIVEPSRDNKYKYIFAQLAQSDRFCLSFIKYENDKISTIQSLELSEHEENQFIGAYLDAIDFPLDDELGHSIKDGERWIIDSSLFQRLNIEISTPNYETKKRGYVALLDFKAYMASHFE